MSHDNYGGRRGFFDRFACLVGFHDWNWLHAPQDINVMKVCRTCGLKIKKKEEIPKQDLG